MKLQKKSAITSYAVLVIRLLIPIFLFPISLQVWPISVIADDFMSGLVHAQYKEAYIGVIGGMVGSVLGVVGAVVVQERSEERQRLVEAKKNATIIYYDIVLFYKEMSPLVEKLLSLPEKKRIPEEDFQKLTNCCRTPLIVDNWIEVVASLSGVFCDDNWIKEVYTFYGAVCEIRELLKRPKYVWKNREELRKQFAILGKLEASRYCWHCTADASRQTVVMEPILTGLETLVPANRGYSRQE